MYAAGLGVAMLGRLQLGRNWANIEDAQVLPDQQVVQSGVYRYVRHPIYAGDLLMLTGLQLALNSWLVLAVLLPFGVVLKRTAAEEGLLVERFPEYSQYQQRTKRLIPFVF
jgi:protein-S-isoprenylcysteine O-methyltransferase Ste14